MKTVKLYGNYIANFEELVKDAEWLPNKYDSFYKEHTKLIVWTEALIQVLNSEYSYCYVKGELGLFVSRSNNVYSYSFHLTNNSTICDRPFYNGHGFVERPKSNVTIESIESAARFR